MEDIKSLYEEYKYNYAEKVRKDICALLNSGGGRYTLSFINARGNENVQHISFLKEIGNMIFEDLLKKLWATPINNTNEIEDVRHFVEEVVYECVGYPFYFFDGEPKVVMDISKRQMVDCFFCLKRNVRSISKTGEDLSLDYYFRIGEKTVKADKNHLWYYIKIIEYSDLPEIKDYEPSDYSLKKAFNKSKVENNVVYEVIGDLPNGHSLYKYMDLESALCCLDHGIVDGIEKKPNIRFVEPTNWEDQYEGKFYTASYKLYDEEMNLIDVNPINNPFLYACCFSSKRENEAAWVLYSHNRTGLASRCVEFTLNRMKFREELVKNQENCTLYIGAVQYMNKERLDNISELKIGKDKQLINEDYKKYFKPFAKESYLNLLLLKRPAFEHEKEVRIFIVPNDAEGKQKTRKESDGKFFPNVKPYFKDVPIDWIEIIEEVRIDENCTTHEKLLLQNSLNDLAREKKDKLKDEEYKALLKKLELKLFNPYKDEKLKDGPITIVTNQ